MERSVAWLLIAFFLSLAVPAQGAPAARPRTDLGHLVLLTPKAQVYVRTDELSVIFTAALPTAWSYSILVDGDQNGIWGVARHVVIPPGTPSPPSPDFAYGATVDGRFCSQFIYSAYPDESDMLYESSACGGRKSAATFDTAVTQGGALKAFTIPKRELRASTGTVHFVISIWDGSGQLVFGSPSVPFVIAW